jgi:hypothetical protein
MAVFDGVHLRRGPHVTPGRIGAHLGPALESDSSPPDSDSCLNSSDILNQISVQSQSRSDLALFERAFTCAVVAGHALW